MKQKAKNKTIDKAIEGIEKHGAVLVFPIKNSAEPKSLWSILHPRTPMRWEWDEEGDGKLFSLWRMREELSRSRLVVYTKWYQGRATFFSRDVFINLLSFLNGSANGASDISLSRESLSLLECLRLDSPLSTKQLKEMTDLRGRWLEATYNRSMKALWSRLLIVAFGEVEDSSFPSLAIAATEIIFEDMWFQSKKIPAKKAQEYLYNKLGEQNKFYIFAKKLHTEWS